ncbi:MAG: dicarboxylate/amino acid:cation symporter [Myxococcales bacterium]|nr:dicarboxylate/amino acid:cation symporter [Myxococcales bacterium]
MGRKLLIAIVASIVAAVATVLIFEGGAANVYFIGRFFLGALQMLIVPLVMLSVTSGITELGDVRKLGRLGAGTVIFYFGTMLAAVLVGLILVELLSPGLGVDTAGLALKASKAVKDVGFSEVLLNAVGHNIVASMANMDILPVIVFSLMFGIVLSTLGERGQPLVQVIDIANDVMMGMVHVVMWLAPLGIFGLVAGRFGKAIAAGGMAAFIAQISAIGSFVVAVLVGLAIHALITLPLLLKLIGKHDVLGYVRGVSPALLTAFSTASSSATLPVTIDAVIENNKVDRRAARFVLPLGATVNMDGSALYEAMAAMFIAQAAGISLTWGQRAMVALVSTLSAVGAAGIPEAGLVTMVMVLKAVKLPLGGLELLLPVDWFLDRFRTAVNVWGDAVGAGVMERWADHAPASQTPSDGDEAAEK